MTKHSGVMIPADLFLRDVIRIHDYLNGGRVDTWMWADMVLRPYITSPQGERGVDRASLEHVECASSVHVPFQP